MSLKIKPRLWGGMGRDGLHVTGSDLSPQCASVFCRCGEECWTTIDPTVSAVAYNRLETLIRFLSGQMLYEGWWFFEGAWNCHHCKMEWMRVRGTIRKEEKC